MTLSLCQVAGAIVKNGGDQIQNESDEYVAKYGPIKTGGIAVTKPGSLPCSILIHAVGKFSCIHMFKYVLLFPVSIFFIML